VGQHIDIREKWYTKAEIHDLDDEKSLLSPDVCSIRSLVQTMYRYMFIFSSILYKIVWMPSIQMDQQLTKNRATKKSKNGGLTMKMTNEQVRIYTDQNWYVGKIQPSGGVSLNKCLFRVLSGNLTALVVCGNIECTPSHSKYVADVFSVPYISVPFTHGKK
jgi:hypothetical protein